MADQSVTQCLESINPAGEALRAALQELEDLLREINTLNMAAILMCDGDGVSDMPELREVAGVLTRQAESIRQALLVRRAAQKALPQSRERSEIIKAA